MGSIGNRLSQVMGMVKESVSLPVIIEMAVPVDENALQELKRTGLRVTSTSRIAPLIYGMANAGTINKLSKLNQVAIVSYDEPTSVLNFPLAAKLEHQEIIPVSEAVNAMGVDAVWDDGITGKDVKIAIIDTGGSLNHPMLKDGIKDSYSAVPGETAEDHNDHGSWCASAAAGRPVETELGPLYGVAPGADLYILKALSNEGQGQMSWVNDCIEKAVLDYKCDVLSMSLGSLTDLAGLDPTSKLVNEITHKYNTLCVVAAGNSFGPMTVGAPGGAASAITVGSVALKLPKQGVVSTFSSKGPTTGLLVKPEIAAYGGNIITPGISELIYAAGSFGEYTSMAGTCLPGDTYITTSTGIVKKIKDIQIGDSVYSFNEITKQLEPWPVINKFSNGFKDVYCMALSDRKIYATDNHPFYVEENGNFVWKPLSDLKNDDDIMCLKKLPENGNTKYNLQKYIDSDDEFIKLTDSGSRKIRSVGINSMKFDDLKNGTIYGLANQEYGTRKGILIKLFTENNLILEYEDYVSSSRGGRMNGVIPEYTTDDFARLYGFMLGDGWITKNKNRSWQICFAEGENEDLNKYYCNLFKQIFNLELKLHRNNGAKYGWYYTYSKRIGDLLYNLGLKYSANTKHLGDWVFELPLEQKQSLINGLIDADGHTRQRSKNSIRHELELSSEKLIVQIKCLCHQVGYQCTTVHKRTRDIRAPHSTKVLPYDSWNIQIHYNEINNMDLTNFITRKVKSIEQYSYEEVFDITVENSHNFIADNILVHNSMATPEVAGAMALLRQAKPDLSRIEVEQLFAEAQFPHPKDVMTGYGSIRVDKMYDRLFSPRLPLSELGKPLQVAQSVAAMPLTMIPREYSKEQLNVVRLPVIRAS